MPKPDDQVRASFVLKALSHKAGTGPGNTRKMLAGSGSKMIYNSSSQMAPTEISHDVSYFNVKRAEKAQKMVSAGEVEDLAYQYQSDHLHTEAVKDENKFRREEEKREEMIRQKQQQNAAKEELEIKIKARKSADTDRLNAIGKMPGTKGGEKERVKDMAIG